MIHREMIAFLFFTIAVCGSWNATHVRAQSEPHSVQVASYLNAADAQAAVNRLRARKLDAYWVKAEIPEIETRYRVRIGKFADKNEASRGAAEACKTRAFSQYLVATGASVPTGVSAKSCKSVLTKLTPTKNEPVVTKPAPTRSTVAANDAKPTPSQPSVVVNHAPQPVIASKPVNKPAAKPTPKNRGTTAAPSATAKPTSVAPGSAEAGFVAAASLGEIFSKPYKYAVTKTSQAISPQAQQKLFSLLTPLFTEASLRLNDTAQTQDPSASAQAIQAPQIKPRPIPDRMLGVDPSRVVRWTLRDAIVSALEGNVDIQLERENVRMAEYDVLGSRAVYDPSFTTSLTFTPQRFPNTFVFSGTTDSAIITNTLRADFGMTRLIEGSGGALQFNFNNSKVTGNRNQLSPQFGPQLGVSYTQPLKRNFKVDFNRRQIQIAKKQLDLSDATFRQRAIEIISRVQAAYWDLAFALRDEEIQREAVKLAETQLTNNQRQVEVGTLAPIDVVSAATSVESRRIQVFQAMSSVAQAENTLKQLVVDSPDSNLWQARITPTESFEIQPMALPLEDALRLARDNRPELKQLALQKEINATNIDFFRNQAKPQIDFVASYTTNGTGGTPIVPGNSQPFCSPLTVAGQPKCVSVIPIGDGMGGFIPGIRVTDFGSRQLVASQFVGGYGQAFRNLLTNKFHTISFGVSINIPWKNRLAEANLGRAKEDTKRIDLQTRRQIQDIETQIRNDVQSIDFAKMRVEAARAAEEFARQQLTGEEKRFSAGLSTTFLVLQRQNEYSIARGSTIRALTDFNKLVAQLQRDIGTTLSNNNPAVKSEK